MRGGETFMRFTLAFVAACVLCLPGASALATAAPTVDIANVAADAQVRIAAGQDDLVTVDWPAGGQCARHGNLSPIRRSAIDRVAGAACRGRGLGADRRPRPESLHGDHRRHAEPGYSGRLDDFLR